MQKKHCCEDLELNVLSEEMPLKYLPEFREYGISVLDGGDSHIELQFCPWCGKKMPKNLRDQWFEEVRALGIDPGFEDPDFKLVPEEYLSDKWWIERQL